MPSSEIAIRSCFEAIEAFRDFLCYGCRRVSSCFLIAFAFLLLMWLLLWSFREAHTEVSPEFIFPPEMPLPAISFQLFLRLPLKIFLISRDFFRRQPARAAGSAAAPPGFVFAACFSGWALFESEFRQNAGRLSFFRSSFFLRPSASQRSREPAFFMPSRPSLCFLSVFCAFRAMLPLLTILVYHIAFISIRPCSFLR